MADPSSLIRQIPSEPAIRTMKSDVATFLKTNKPSLVSILAEQAEQDQPYQVSPRRKAPWLILAGATIIGLIGSLAAFWYLQKTPAPPIEQPGVTTPAPFFFYDRVTELAIPRSKKDLVGALSRTGTGSSPIGSFERLVIRSADSAGGNPILTTSDIFSILGIQAPSGFLDSIEGPPQLFIYRERSGPRFGMVIESKSPARTLQSIFSWESSIQSSFAPFFLGTEAPVTLKPFLDATYRNTDYRYLAINQDTDLGIGYLQFGARRLIVITTSEESLRLTLNRLFENR